MFLFVFCLNLFASETCFGKSARIFVVDGDSLFIDNQEIRLSGIDAPEYKQECFDKNQKSYKCGVMAKKFLEQLVKKGNISCSHLTKDKYKRFVSVCYSGKTNLNEEMVRQGWAVAYKRYTHAYDEAEKFAQENKLGIWQGKFMKPEFFRILKNQKNKKKNKNK